MRGIFVFVYGTLRKGGVLHKYIESQEFVTRAWADGVLHDLGRFPGAHFTPGAYRIVGEIYRIDADTLAKLDAMEGYHEKQPEISLYVRRRIEPKLEAGVVARPAWAYEFRGDMAKYPRIYGGDWIAYREGGE